jgi:branched-chain amino acid transport system ATP-binding protein
VAELLKLEGVHKSFGAGPVLVNVNITLRPGEKRGIIGPNGAGKTTLINILSGAFAPDAGEIFFNGQRITHLKPHQRARLGIGRSFQILSLFGPMSVYENLRHAVLRRQNVHMAAFKRLAGLEQAGAEAASIARRLGLGQVLHERSENLSHGMRRRLDIGLVLAQAPAVLVLDEPAAGLSATETRELVTLLRDLAGGTALVLVEHDMEMVYALSERITVLDYGWVLAEGTPEEINAHPEVRRIYLGEEVA